LGATGSHSPPRSVLQRLGSQGALPVNPGGFLSASNFLVKAGRSIALKADLNPTWGSFPFRDWRQRIDGILKNVNHDLA